jgi:ABC-type transport system involved in cytochrome c biogenesis ATPase subunit
MSASSQRKGPPARITKVSVTSLFGVFNHEIRMNLEDRITIIHGPNGFGKTSILRLLNALFNKKDTVLRRTPFHEFRVDFSGVSHLAVQQRRGTASQASHTLPEPDLTFEYGDSDGVHQHTLGPREFDPRIADLVDRVVPYLARTSPHSWTDVRTGETLGVAEVVQEYGESLPPLISHGRQESPEWLSEARRLVPIRLIEAERLVTLRPSPLPGRPSGDQVRSAPVVEQYARDLVADIQKRLAEYATLSQSLDRSFPARLVRSGGHASHPDEELLLKLKELENKRARLASAGVLGEAPEDEFRLAPHVGDENRKVLSVYADDVEKKLGILDDLLRKIEVLQRTLNDHFLYKRLRIDQKRGYVFVTPDGKELRPGDLSSGEQHELVLNHELLFKVEPHSLILIDEPELSFHVAWQEAFLKDLEVITKLADLDVLIATHSPQIIHDRWDLTVELEAPSAGEKPARPTHQT